MTTKLSPEKCNQLFDLVKNPSDPKGPINAVVRYTALVKLDATMFDLREAVLEVAKCYLAISDTKKHSFRATGIGFYTATGTVVVQ